MKKIVFTLMILVGAVTGVQAQRGVSKNALGLRLGSSYGIGAEISYQRALAKSTRLEANIGWVNHKDYGIMKVTGIHQWTWPIENGFRWYAGVGGSLAAWNLKNNNSDMSLAGVGQIGIEYHLNIPLQISLDFKPEVTVIRHDFTDSWRSDVALGVRYKF
ncbi:hypothetical protein [Bergeyella zoohelcum]|uniref:Outer membrane protein beta-barrel domain-containing protein n=1 Tax=Bergeyella zoohelcum TaxID=1015 RepID=A0A376BY15_9FLAO|nr:hypothetical protein [Bergeyella zoohelcum]EKB60459.1 hypothetical protein HMPREF9700_01013 [Bergeyella zoohelcum CCUG 30536]SSZ46389.1 Uncharacterised protein [Bergeyella zoohelcum]